MSSNNPWDNSPSEGSHERKLRIHVTVQGAAVIDEHAEEEIHTDDDADSAEGFFANQPTLFTNKVLSNRVNSAKPTALRGN
jgi:hypothetical protein